LITLLPTPVRSEVVQAKTSLFLSMNDSTSASSSDDRSGAINTVLSGTLGSRATLFMLHSVFIDVLPLVLASAFTMVVSCWPPPSASGNLHSYGLERNLGLYF
jgi:hypothetical protein